MPPLEIPRTPVISVARSTRPVATAPAVALRTPVMFESVNEFAKRFDVDATLAVKCVAVVVASVVVAEKVFVPVQVLFVAKSNPMTPVVVLNVMGEVPENISRTLVVAISVR